jgi:pyocin large subunit-like protein
MFGTISFHGWINNVDLKTMDNNTKKGDAESWECSGLLERNSKDSESQATPVY